MSTLSAAALNAALDAVVDLVDGGAGAGVLALLDSTALVVSLALADPAFGAASGGSALAASLPRSGTVSSAGVVDGFELRTSAGTTVVSGTAGEGAEEVVLQNTNLKVGQSVSLTALSLLVGTPGPELAISVDGRYLIDTTDGDHPFLWNEVAAWALAGNCTDEQIITFLDNCVTYGVTAIRVSLVEAYYSDADPGTGENVYGEAPWTGTPFQSSLNAAYWARVRAMLAAALARRIVVFAFPAYPGNGAGVEGWGQEIIAASEAEMEDYGEAVGAILADYPNVVTCIGGDRWLGFDLGDPPPQQEAMVAGLKNTDRATRLYSAHWDPNSSSIAFGVEAWLDINHQYEYQVNGYVEGSTADGWDNSPTRPTFFGEGFYAGDSGFPTTGFAIRRQYSRAFARGTFGHGMGAHDIWAFSAPTAPNPTVDWEDHLADVWWDHLLAFKTIFWNLPWHLCDPDEFSTFVTSGAGTPGTAGYVPGRADPAGTIVFAYCSQAATLGFDKSQMADTFNVYKVDPSTGVRTALALGVSPSSSTSYVIDDENAAGDDDWWFLAIVE